MRILENTWLRRVIIIGGALVLIVLAALPAVHLYGASVLRRAIADSGPLELDLNTFEKPKIPDYENAASWLEAGAAAVIWSPEEGGVISDISKAGPYQDWTDEMRSSIRTLLDNHRGGLDTMARAVPLSRSSYEIPYSQGLEAEIPDLLNLMQAARTLMIDVRIAAADGDEARVLQSLATMSRLAETLQQESTLITTLIGFACERLMLIAAAEVVADPDAWCGNPDFLREVFTIIPTISYHETMQRTLDAWAAVMLDDSAQRGRAFDPEGIKTLRDATFFKRPFLNLTRAEVVRMRSDVMAVLGTPFGSAPNRFVAPDSPALLAPGVKTCDEDYRGLLKAVARAQSIAAQRKLVFAAIELRLLAGETGAYPADRPAIAALTEPDPFTGRPLRFEWSSDGHLTIAIDGATELLEQIVLTQMAQAVVPIELP